MLRSADVVGSGTSAADLRREAAGVREDLGPDWAERALDRWGAAWLVALVVLVAGPQPRRATKWAWCWFLVVLPSTLGVLAWLLLDAPWSRRRRAAREPLAHDLQRRLPGGDARLTGGRALVLAVLLGLLTGVAAQALALLPLL
ncbi:hypothetical protein [Vallicoccus soli]|uniref:Uncharacterized protein n=1 Tax=Vallicoccus soli TaxID=2339232 RepID=A0A3A3Z817_9ACTN|nr:hypothetical protein [Vallicoccus soli]RJK96977.1 hypothetical protein D5H78_06985 [Vallicoccus soli]